MADYYSLLLKAVNALKEHTPDARQVVYERARKALLAQLRGMTPPMAESAISHELLGLNEAIARLEAKLMSGEHFEDIDETVKGLSLQNALPDTDAPFLRERPRLDVLENKQKDSLYLRQIILGVIVSLAIMGIAIAAWMLRDSPSRLVQTPSNTVPAADRDPKFGERASDQTQAPSVSPPSSVPSSGLPVAQRAIFYEENTSDPQNPVVHPARVLWKLDTVNGGQGMPLETVVRAEIMVADINFSMVFLLRRNIDPALPASHTIELNFTSPPSDKAKVAREIGLLQFKNEEGARGSAIAGLPVPVRDNYFLIGLQNLKPDIERNRDLLLNRNWIDVPIRYPSGQKAILSFEKGLAGEQVMSQAFAAWN